MKLYLGILFWGLASVACSSSDMQSSDLANGPRDLGVDDLSAPVDQGTNDLDTGGRTTLTLVAGKIGGNGNADDTGAAARFDQPAGMTSDGAGNLYVADFRTYTIRKIVLATGEVTTIAGSAGMQATQDGVGAAARFWAPDGVALDGAGNLYVTESSASVLRKIVLSTGAVTTIAGVRFTRGSTDGIGTAALLNDPKGVVADGAGNLFIVDSNNHTIRKMVLGTGVVTTFAGTAGMSGSTDGTGSAARFFFPAGMATDGAGNLFVVDRYNDTIRKIVISSGAVTTLAGTAGTVGSADGVGSAARFSSPNGLTFDGTGNLFVSEDTNRLVRKIVISSGAVTTIAGTAGVAGSADGTGTAAQFSTPYAVTSDGAGNLFVADTGNATIRKVVLATGAVSTIAGTANMSGSADGTGAVARFNRPAGVVADGAGNLFIADSDNSTIRKVVLATGAVTTLAGTAGMKGNIDGTGAAARFDHPIGMALDGAGNLYIADSSTATIRKIVLATAAVSTLAGTIYASGTFDGIGSGAMFTNPNGLALSGTDTLFVSEVLGHTIRKVVISTAAVTTLAGKPNTPGSTDGIGAAARFNNPSGVAADLLGNLYVTDTNNSTVRRIALASGAVTTIVGVAGRSGIKPGQLPGRLNRPAGITISSTGTLWLVDSLENAVLEID